MSVIGEIKVRVIVDYETGKLINVDKLIKEMESMKHDIENLKALSAKEMKA